MCLFSEMVTDSSDEVTVWPFHSCCSFGWLLPFVFQDFLFRRDTVIKPLERLMGFSVNEILHVLPSHQSEGPEDQVCACGCVGRPGAGCPGQH